MVHAEREIAMNKVHTVVENGLYNATIARLDGTERTYHLSAKNHERLVRASKDMKRLNCGLGVVLRTYITGGKA
jgi:hypothetical protein